LLGCLTVVCMAAAIGESKRVSAANQGLFKNQELASLLLVPAHPVA